MSISRITAGSPALYRVATFSFVRSAASVYCTRSLVPSEKKFTSRARCSDMMAADGTSIIVPTGILRLKLIPSSSRSSFTSARIILHCRSSKSVLTIGNMMRTSPKALALKIARICVLNKVKLRRHSRTLLSPRNGFRSRELASVAAANLSAPRSSVRITTGLAPIVRSTWR